MQTKGWPYTSAMQTYAPEQRLRAAWGPQSSFSLKADTETGAPSRLRGSLITSATRRAQDALHSSEKILQYVFNPREGNQYSCYVTHNMWNKTLTSWNCAGNRPRSSCCEIQGRTHPVSTLEQWKSQQVSKELCPLEEKRHGAVRIQEYSELIFWNCNKYVSLERQMKNFITFHLSHNYEGPVLFLV